MDAGDGAGRDAGAAIGSLKAVAKEESAHILPSWPIRFIASRKRWSTATPVTLILVPVLYAVFVLDLKIVKWKRLESH